MVCQQLSAIYFKKLSYRQSAPSATIHRLPQTGMPPPSIALIQ